MKIPKEIEVKLVNGTEIYVRGPLGIKKAIVQDVTIENGEIIAPDLMTKRVVKKMIQGVTSGFKQKIKIIGVGYKALHNKEAGILEMSLGYKDTIKVKIPEGITLTVSGNGTVVEGKSNSKEKLSQYLSEIVELRSAKKDVYKGKGVQGN